MAFVPDTLETPASTEGFTPDVGYEAQAAIQERRAANSQIPGLQGILSPEEFAAQYIQSKEGPGVVERLKEQIAGPGTAVLQGTVKPILNLIPASYNEAINNLQTKSLPSAIAANIGTGIKSGVEAARLIGTEALNLPSQLSQALNLGGTQVRGGMQNPSQAVKQALEASGPVAKVASALIPGKTTPEEISKAYENYVQQQSFAQAQAQPSQQIIGEDSIIPGRVNPELAEGIKEGAKLAFLPLAGVEERATTATLAKKIANTVLNPSQAFPKIAARVAKATPAQQASSAFDLNEAQAAEHLPVVRKNVENITGVLPKGAGAAEKAVNLMETAEKKLYSNRLATNQKAAEQGFKVDLDAPLQEAKDIVNASNLITQDTKATIIKNLEDRYSGSVAPERGHAIQKDLNDKFKSDFARGVLNKADPQYQAELAIRNNVANQMDDITRTITGLDERPYSEIGSLIETKGGLESKIDALKKVEADIKTGLKGQKGLPNIAHPRYEAAKELVKGSRSPLRKAGIEALDKAVEGAFKGFEKAPTGAALTEQDIAAGKARFTSPQSTITAGEVPDLESEIQALIKTYPRKLRADPALARLAAESELGIRR